MDHIAHNEAEKHALEQGVHPLVIGYLSTYHGKATPVGPRAWTRVSDLVKLAPDADFEKVLEPMVGAVDAVGFAEFARISRILPNPEDVLNGAVTQVDPMDPSTAYALAVTIAYALKDEHDRHFMDVKGMKRQYRDGRGEIVPEYNKWMERANHGILFVMENMEPEMAIMWARVCIQVFKLPFHMRLMPNFKLFADRYRALVMG